MNGLEKCGITYNGILPCNIKNEVLIHTITGNHYVKLKNPLAKDHMLLSFYLYGMSRIGKSLGTKSRLVIAKGLGLGADGE